MKKVGLCLITFLHLLSSHFVQASETDNPPYRKTLESDHEMRIINSGSAALNARLEMIRSAKSTLDLEYFIFNPDIAGGLIVKELAKAVERGVKVRVLVDKSIAVLKMDEYYAEALKEKGIELRYYNPASVARISSVQFRNHRKLITKDGEEAITGGRNIGDDYFDLSDRFNFLDRDASVKGEIVGTMKESFERYWNSDIVEIPKKPWAPSTSLIIEGDDSMYQARLKEHEKKKTEARKIFEYTDKDKKVLDYVMTEGKKNLEVNPVSTCPKVSFATDREGASFVERLNSSKYHDEYRLLRKEIAKWIDQNVKEELVVDSPYFLDNTLSREVTGKLFSENKKITILTNSLASTDAIHVSTVFNDSVKSYVADERFQAYVYKGKSSEETGFFDDKIKKADWGTHSKTMVFGNDSFMIGTFNIDNRSSFYNTEMAIFCSGSPTLTKAVRDNIQHRQANSHHLDKEGNPSDCTPILGEVTGIKKALYYLIKVPSNLFKFLL